MITHHLFELRTHWRRGFVYLPRSAHPFISFALMNLSISDVDDQSKQSSHFMLYHYNAAAL